MHLQKFIIGFCALLLVGCAQIQNFTKLDHFETTSRAYSHAIRWSEFDREGEEAHGVSARDVQELADDVRAAVVRLQAAWRSEQASDA